MPDSDIHPVAPPEPSLLQTFLWILAIVMPAAGAGAGAVVALLADRAEVLDAAVLLRAMGWALAGAWAGGVTWALAWLVGAGRKLLAAGQEATPASREMSALPPLELLPLLAQERAQEREQERAGEAAAMQELAREVRELRAEFLLPPEHLEAKRRERMARRGQELSVACESALAGGRFAEAEGAVRALAEEVPGDARVTEYSQRLQRAREAAREQDVAREVGRARDLMSLGDFAAAEQVALQLCLEHPEDEQARVLLEQARREGKAFAEEQRTRGYREVRQAVERRRWREAVEAARKLLAAYPQSPEARILAGQLPTMEDNARLAEAREMRDRLRDLLARRRYPEALQLAEHLLAHHPDTRAADELRQQLPKLRQRAGERGDGRR